MDAIFNQYPYKRPFENKGFFYDPKSDQTKLYFGELVRSESVMIVDPTTNIAIPYFLCQVTETEPTKEKKVNALSERPDIKSEFSKKQIEFVNIKSHCIRCAEILNDTLLAFLNQYYVLTKNPGRSNLNTLTFRAMADILSKCLRKNNIFDGIALIDTSVKKMEFIEILIAFIKDRNIYTHGNLEIRTNDLAVIIRHIEDKKTKSSIVDAEVLQSFLWIYSQLKVTIHKMNDIVILEAKKKGITNFA